MAPQNFGDKIAFAAQQLNTKLDFDVLWFRRRAYKIQEKEKKLIVVKSGLVEMKRYLKRYNHVKYFLLYLVFTSNFQGVFLGSKTKVT